MSTINPIVSNVRAGGRLSVMPAASIGFSLKPDGFFTRNPALDVPPVK